MLERREGEAARDRQYRLAAQLRDTIDALTPRQPPLTLADCAPPTPELRRDFFWENGFCVLYGLLQGDALQRAQAAWLAAEPAAERAWQDATDGSAGRHFSLPPLTELDDVFLDLVDHPSLVSVLSHVAGDPSALDSEDGRPYNKYHGAMRYSSAMQGLVVPPNADGYTVSLTNVW